MKIEDLIPEVENSPADYTYGDLDVLELSGVECCGWILVNDFPFGYGDQVKKAKKDLVRLSNGEILFEDDELQEFTLYCVLNGSQSKVYEEFLLELGWSKMKSFCNPNTGNVCTPYQFVPKSCEVS